jgi:4-amino-4-deoxy-L-arabinose transferase-like glycosyltransferase
MHSARRHGPFLLLLALFVLAALAHTRTLPAMEGSDEPLHVNYVFHLMQTGTLPDRATRTTNATQQASGQPPLAYAAGAAWLRLLGIAPLDGDAALTHIGVTARNRWYQPHDVWQRADNHTVYVHGRDESAFGWPALVQADAALRLVSVMWGALAVVGMYAAAGEVFRGRGWRLAATALFAFMPTMIHISSYFTNDTPTVAFATLSTWAALRIARHGANWQLCLLAGLLLALGGLSKVNALLAGAGIGIALLYDWRARRTAFGRLIAHGLLVAAPVTLLVGPWVLYGVVTYGDPLGLNTHQHLTTGFYFAEPRTLAEIVPLLPHLYLSYLGWFAATPLHPVTYTVLGAVVVLCLAGLLAGLRASRLTGTQRAQAVILGITFLIALAAMIRWMQQLSFTGGRLMYPAHAAVTLILAGGLYLLARRLPRLGFAVRVVPVSMLALIGMFAPVAALWEAYFSPPLLTRDRLPALTGAPVTFDGTIRLLGIHQPARTFDPADTSYDAFALTACWEVLRETTVPAAFSLKLIHQGTIAADRTSLFGMGRYPSISWRAGDIFCDDIRFWMDDPDQPDDPLPEPATVYDIAAVVLNAETLAVDSPAVNDAGETIPVPIMGQAAAQAGTMPLPDDLPALAEPVEFANLARLTHADVQGSILRMGWQVTGTTPESWTGFVHLYDAQGNFIASVGDGPPLDGAYPTWAWAAGERLYETRALSLPPDLPPGEYQVQIGFYRADTGERMPVSLAGVDVPSRSVPVATLMVDDAAGP